VRRVWLLTGPVIAGCFSGSVDAEMESVSGISSGRERIPAEWTIAEDTSASGEVTTMSLQLPSAKEIGGLMDGAAPRLALRCLDGKVAVFIDTEVYGSAGEPDSSASGEPVPIQLDSAPPCE
jgi:hypothetical protein